MIIEFITDEEEESSSIVYIIKFVDQKSEKEIAEVVEGIQSKEELRYAVGNITINGVEWSSNNNNNNNANTTIIIIVVVVVVVIAVVVFLLAFAGGFLIERNRDAEGRRRGQGGAHSAESQRRVQGPLMEVRSGAASGTGRRYTPDDYV